MPDTPLFVIITHWLNVLFLLLMARSGLEVLSAFPEALLAVGLPAGP